MEHQNSSPTPDLRLLRNNEVCKRVGYSRAWIYRLERQGKFPKRVQIGPNRVCWLEKEINDWIKERVNLRNNTK